MTEVVIDVQRNHYVITARDHADDPTVCAGVSALIYMISGCALNHNAKIKIMKLEDGDAELDFVSHESRMLEDTKALAIGLLQIELGYPKNLRVVQNVI